MKPVEIRGAAHALGRTAEVEEGKAVGRPGQAQPHLKDVVDGKIVRAVKTVVESGGKVLVGGAGAQPHLAGRQVVGQRSQQLSFS